MKRTVIIIIFALLFVSAAVLTACIAEKQEETTAEKTTEATVTEAPVSETTTKAPETTEKATDVANPLPPTEVHTTENHTSAPATTVKPTAEYTTAAPATQPPASTAGTQNIGVSSNGYDIVCENGFTYVDGVLIVNKTYPLPANYNPGGLLSGCSAAFKQMQAAAAKEGLNIYASSGFRSYSHQSNLYSKYCANDGQAAADRYSARPGHSEHQTGLAIDLNTITYSFADTAEGKWVAENCWKYGFILRYPSGKEAQTGYRYEPWHIRYVGASKAEAIYNSGLCLEEYYGLTSQYQ